MSNYKFFYEMLLVGSIILNVLGQLLLKINATNMTDKVIDFYVNRYVVSGLFLYALSAILYIKALQFIKVSVAFPSQSIAYIFVTLYAVFYFGEKLSTLQMLGLVTIFCGVLLLWIDNVRV
ncbi:EamA family transporter [Candidatus Thioglobus sp.]|nr:EamA family transporter [Candidatus Thioglobus sp.]